MAVRIFKRKAGLKNKSWNIPQIKTIKKEPLTQTGQTTGTTHGTRTHAFKIPTTT
jgi:hypothetical protein